MLIIVVVAAVSAYRASKGTQRGRNGVVYEN